MCHPRVHHTDGFEQNRYRYISYVRLLHPTTSAGLTPLMCNVHIHIYGLKSGYTPYRAKFCVDSESLIRYMCSRPTLSRYLHKQHMAPMWPSPSGHMSEGYLQGPRASVGFGVCRGGRSTPRDREVPRNAHPRPNGGGGVYIYSRGPNPL